MCPEALRVLFIEECLARGVVVVVVVRVLPRGVVHQVSYHNIRVRIVIVYFGCEECGDSTRGTARAHQNF